MMAGAGAWAQSLQDIAWKGPVRPGEPIAVGFVGFMDRWDDPHRSVRQLTLRLRERGWRAESFSHWKLRTAKQALVLALDRNGNSRIDPEEAAGARVMIFGHSMGGAATLKLAKYLKARKVPVLLTVQVDSVGARDGVIPENVRAAANFYQHQRFTVRGEAHIRAADGAATHILGNFEYEYPWWLAAVAGDQWPRQVLGGGHLRMEADPVVWSRIENLILEAGTKP